MAGENRINEKVRSIIEGFYSDERLRSRLNDEEARIVLSWGERYLRQAANEAMRAAADRDAIAVIEDAASRARAAIAGVNDLIGDKSRLSDSQLRRALLVFVFQGQSQTSQINNLVDELVAKHNGMSNIEFIDRIITVVELSWRDEGSASKGGSQ